MKLPTFVRDYRRGKRLLKRARSKIERRRARAEIEYDLEYTDRLRFGRRPEYDWNLY